MQNETLSTSLKGFKHVHTKHKTETVLREKLQIGLYVVDVVCFVSSTKQT